MSRNVGHIIDFLHQGPKTVPEIVDAFEKAPDGIGMSKKTVYRACQELERNNDEVIVGILDPAEQKSRRQAGGKRREAKVAVRLLFLRSDVGSIMKGRYGRVWLPIDFMQNEVDEHQQRLGQQELQLSSVLSEPKSWRAERLERSRFRTATVNIRGKGLGDDEMKVHKKSQSSSSLSGGPGQLKFKRRRARG